MVKMRIPIREQLGFLVLLVSLVALAVIAAATWVCRPLSFAEDRRIACHFLMRLWLAQTRAP